jgi:hypothetical protein
MNDQTPLTLEQELSRNIELSRHHAQAVEDLRALENQLAALDAAEQHAAEAYAMGFKDDPPVLNDPQRAELLRLLQGARVLAQPLADLSRLPVVRPSSGTPLPFGGRLHLGVASPTTFAYESWKCNNETSACRERSAHFACAHM